MRVALVFQGADDINVPPAMAEALAAGIPGAVAKYYAGAGHLTILTTEAGDMLSRVEEALKAAEAGTWRPAEQQGKA